MNFRIRKGTHLSHFHAKCPRWPADSFYEQDKPLWWGNLCQDCSRLADMDQSREFAGGTPPLKAVPRRS